MTWRRHRNPRTPAMPRKKLIPLRRCRRPCVPIPVKYRSLPMGLAELCHEASCPSAAVLGAGVMGAQIAAQLTNAGVDTVLFDLPAKDSSNGIVTRAIASLAKLSPAPLAAKSLAGYVTSQSYGHQWTVEGLRPDVVIAVKAGWTGRLGVPAGSPVRAPTAVASQHLRPGDQQPGGCSSRRMRHRLRWCASSTRRASTCTWNHPGPHRPQVRTGRPEAFPSPPLARAWCTPGHA